MPQHQSVQGKVKQNLLNDYHIHEAKEQATIIFKLVHRYGNHLWQENSSTFRGLGSTCFKDCVSKVVVKVGKSSQNFLQNMENDHRERRSASQSLKPSPR
jgi:hypothetical protein